MNILQIGQYILTGQIQLIPQDLRQKIINIIISAQNRVMKFENNIAQCPVCSVFGLNGIVKVRSTQGEIRYCECLSCTATFTAIGEKFQKKKKMKILNY